MDTQRVTISGEPALAIEPTYGRERDLTRRDIKSEVLLTTSLYRENLKIHVTTCHASHSVHAIMQRRLPMLSEKEFELARGKYEMIYFYGTASTDEIWDLRELMNRATEEQRKRITYKGDPEGERAALDYWDCIELKDYIQATGSADGFEPRRGPFFGPENPIPPAIRPRKLQQKNHRDSSTARERKLDVS
jgi:hypothetical protein